MAAPSLPPFLPPSLSPSLFLPARPGVAGSWTQGTVRACGSPAAGGEAAAPAEGSPRSRGVAPGPGGGGASAASRAGRRLRFPPRRAAVALGAAVSVGSSHTPPSSAVSSRRVAATLGLSASSRRLSAPSPRDGSPSLGGTGVRLRPRPPRHTQTLVLFGRNTGLVSVSLQSVLATLLPVRSGLY